MKYIFYIFFFLSLNILSQNFTYSYWDPCTGLKKSINVPKEGVTVNYFNQIKTFQQDEMIDGTFSNWANSVFLNYGQGNPCGSILGVSSVINIGQQTAINTINLLNSISSIADFQNSLSQSIDGETGSINLTSSLDGAKSTESKKEKNKQNNEQTNEQNNGNSSVSGGISGQNMANSNPSQNTQNQGVTPESGQNSSNSDKNMANSSNSNQQTSQSQPQNYTQDGNNSGSNGNGDTQSGINSQNQNNGNGTNNNDQTSQGTTQSNSSGSQPGGTSSNSPSTNQTSDVQGGNSTTSNQSNEVGNTQTQQDMSSNQGSGQENNSSNGNNTQETPKSENNTQTSEENKNTNVMGGVVTSIQRASGSKEGGKPSILLSSDFTGFNFKQGDVSYGGKGTAGFTSMRWDGQRTHGFMLDYTSVQNGPNFTAFYAFIRKKRIDLISSTMTASFLGKGSLYGTLAAGQMFTVRKDVKLIYLFTGSWGQVFKEQFKGTAVVTGGMYDLSLGKRIDMKMMGLFIYAPFISYYNDIVLKSPYVVMPVLGTNIKITKNFKFNINFGGAYAINENVMNFTIMCGTRLAL